MYTIKRKQNSDLACRLSLQESGGGMIPPWIEVDAKCIFPPPLMWTPLMFHKHLCKT